MSVKAAFDESVAYYDGWVKKAIPCYEQIFQIALENVLFTPEEKFKVLDLGTGTGLFTWQMAERYPEASYTLCDISAEMLESAKSRFTTSEVNCDFLLMDYSREPLPEGQDLIISSLSIHHLTDTLKQELFKKIHTSLKPGGIFINIDQIKAPSHYHTDNYWNTWLGKVRQAGAAESQIEKSIERRSLYDIDAALTDQLTFLEQAGFIDVDIIFKYYFLGLFWARKQGEKHG